MPGRLRAKYKSNRRFGVNLWGRPKSPYNQREYGPGQHGQRRRKPSDYGVQLAAKQRLRFYYGNIRERQFRNIFKEAARRGGDTGENLIALLEQRLDAVVYRAKFCPTVFSARQLINHGHIMVNGKRVNIPSYRLRPGDEVALKPASQTMDLVIEALGSGEREIPGHIQVDIKKFAATFMHNPKLEDVPYPARMEPNLVVEYYSR